MKTVVYLSLLLFVGCSGTPNVIRPSVDENTIADSFQYDADLAKCNEEAYHLPMRGSEGAETAAGAAAAGVMIAAPGAAIGADPVGILIGVFQAAKNEPLRREYVYKCLRGRGYHVLEETPVASAPRPQPEVTSSPTKVSPASPEVTPTAPVVTPAPREVSVAPTKAAPAPSAEQLSMEKRLRKLMDLRQKNLITNEEYERAKKDVLKKLTE